MLQIVYHMYYTLYTRFNDDTHDTENPKRPAASPSGPFFVFSTRSYHAMPNRIKRLETTNAEDTIPVKFFCQKMAIFLLSLQTGVVGCVITTRRCCHRRRQSPASGLAAFSRFFCALNSSGAGFLASHPCIM
jgi:hypothetical protein